MEEKEALLRNIESELWQQKIINYLCMIGMFVFMVVALVEDRISVASTMVVLGVMALGANNWALGKIKTVMDKFK
jgi:hypothetical protein